VRYVILGYPDIMIDIFLHNWLINGEIGQVMCKSSPSVWAKCFYTILNKDLGHISHLTL
jgi:hypothetical protein